MGTNFEGSRAALNARADCKYSPEEWAERMVPLSTLPKAAALNLKRRRRSRTVERGSIRICYNAQIYKEPF